MQYVRGGVKRRGIYRYVRNRRGGGVIHVAGKAVGRLSLSLRDLFRPSSSLVRASASRLGQKAHPPGPVVSTVPETFRGGSRPVYIDDGRGI